MRPMKIMNTFSCTTLSRIFQSKLKISLQERTVSLCSNKILDLYFGYLNDIFYMASQSEITMFYLKGSRDDIGDKYPKNSLTITSEQLRQHRIHGLFQIKNTDQSIHVAFETTDNQIDFNRLILQQIQKKNEPISFIYSFEQTVEIVPREIKLDFIKEFQVIFREDGKSNGIALRKSCADFYTNMSRVASYEYKYDQERENNKAPTLEEMKMNIDYSKPVTEIGLTFDDTFVGFGPIVEKTKISRQMRNNNNAQMSIESSEFNMDLDFQTLFYQRVQKHCKIFSCFVFYETYIFVSHANILSLFDVQNQQWIEKQHLQFKSQSNIVQVFRSEFEQGSFDICVLQQDGTISIISSGDQGYFIDESVRIKNQIKGVYLQHDQDRDGNRYTFIMSEEDNQEILLYCFYRRQLINISNNFQDLNRESNFVFLFAESEDTRFILQEKTQIKMYTINPPKAIINQDDENQQLNENEEAQPEIQLIWESEILEKNNIKQRCNNKHIWFQEKFHSAISIKNRTDKESFIGKSEESSFPFVQEYFLFFDQYHIYLFFKIQKDNPYSYNTFEDHNIKGLFLSDDNYMYTLSGKRTAQNAGSGFTLFDIQNCISTGSVLSYELTQVQVGCQPLIDFSQRNQRFVFQSSFDKLEVLPVLHRNSIFFMGMGERENYLSTRVINDKFVALDNKNQLTTWSTLSGKVRFECNLQRDSQLDYSKFKIFQYNENHHVYQREWFTKTLLISNDPIDSKNNSSLNGIFQQQNNPSLINEELFDHQDEQKRNIMKQSSFMDRIEKSYHEFRLIEIQNESEVKEIASFVYPYWKGQQQYLYFNDTGDMMFERLFYERISIYKKVSKDKSNPTHCTWQFLKRLTNLPIEFLDVTNSQYPFFMSPDFTRFLDIDKEIKKNTKMPSYNFVIRDVLNPQKIVTIPAWLMKCNKISDGEESVKDVINRFKWHDNTSIKVVNAEGIERVMVISKLFDQEKCFHVIPLFQSQLSKQNNYYYNKPNIELNNILERLQRKYQAYKSVTTMENSKDPIHKYNHLFTVDYQNEKTNAAGNIVYDKHVIDQSFTFLHWNLVEQLAQGKLKLENINEEQLNCMIYNIFPQGQTVLHMLKDQSAVMEQLFSKCHFENFKNKKLEARFHIPFVQNFDLQSPMDLLAGQNDIKGMDMMLKNLSPYSLDHHSREIKNLFGRFVQARLSNLNTYLQSRLLQTKYLSSINKAKLKEDIEVPGVSLSSFWISDKEKQQLFEEVKNGSGGRDVRIEFIDISEMHCYSNPFSQKFFESLAECEDMTLFNEIAIQRIIDFKWTLTKKYTLKKLLYPYLIFMGVYLTYVNWFYQIRHDEGMLNFNYAFIAVLAYFAYYFLKIELKQMLKKDPAQIQEQNKDSIIKQYFQSIWNYLDLIPSVTLAVFLPMELVGAFNYQSAVEEYIARQRMANFIGNGKTVDDPTVTIRTIEGILQSILSLIFWLKLLYFLRIFKSTGFYVRIIVDVIKDMRYFLLMLLLTFIAFGDSMRQISSSNPEGSDFIGGTILTAVGFVHRMVLGDFDTNTFGEVAVGYVWILFILCTLFNMIIMLNLLIAIICESYANIKSNSEQASFREMADIIAENTDLLIDDATQKEYCEESKYLMIATDLQQEQEGIVQFEDQVQQVVKNLTTHIETVQTKFQEKVEESQKQAQSLLQSKIKDINMQRNDLKNIASLLNEKLHGIPLETKNYFNF